MTDVVHRVQSLLSRAAHEGTPLEEARTAAHMAAKLIAKNKLNVSNGVAPRTQEAPKYQAYDATFTADGMAWEAFYEAIFGTPKKRKEPPRRPRKTYEPIKSKSWRSHWCCACGEHIETGSEIAEVEREGVTHWKCADYWRGHE